MYVYGYGKKLRDHLSTSVYFLSTYCVSVWIVNIFRTFITGFQQQKKAMSFHNMVFGQYINNGLDQI